MRHQQILSAFGGVVLICVAIPVAVLHPPLRAEGEGDPGYAAARALSEPALAGRASYRGRCDTCHGAAGEGTAQGPRLAGRDWADFSASPAFHRALARRTPGHDAPGFNEAELMAKYLRELARARPAP